VSASPIDRFRRVDALFDAALDLPASAQSAFLERACGGDSEMLDNVLRLLQAYNDSGAFLEEPAAEFCAPLLADSPLGAEHDPERIGAFRVVREIGHGGMGDVFLAERADGQFEQRVAVKLIRHGAAALVPRFLEERRILALLEHPGIARLIDGGITEDGLPYFAMEFIEGRPIDRYCVEHGLSVERRLELFADVCDAVSYAHQHLVIHRDLKPSNILVTPQGQVKLLDFGIAKLLHAQDAGDDITRTHFRMMTPEFASPEQVRGEAVSTATDVYALGVLLYLLLTGERPYDVRGKTPAEIERIVCDYEPAKPSMRAPEASRRALRGDLDLIVLTALQKSEERRYQSPAALAQDLQRLQQGQPILARPDSTAYSVRKFVGRHRVGVALAAVLVAALAGAASRERILRGRAEVEARKAKEVEEFLVRVFDVADPYAWEQRDGGSVTARELLDRGASRIDSTLVGQPEVQAELRSVLGRVYTNLGLFDQATPLLERSLAQRRSLYGATHASVALDMDLLGHALARQDRYADAEPLLRGALEQRRRLLGSNSAETAESIEHLATLLEQRSDYAAAEPLHREALAIRQRVFGDSALEVADGLNNLGLVLYRRGAHNEAETMYRRALDITLLRLGEDHPSTAKTVQNLAQILEMLGNLEEAEKLYRRSLAAKRRTLGDAHPSVTIGLNNLGGLLARRLGRLDEAETLTREAIALDRRIFGDHHSYVAQGLTNLGVILRMKGDFTESKQLLQQALAITIAVFGPVHDDVAVINNQIAQTLFLMGDGAGATASMRTSLAQLKQVLGPDHVNTLIAMNNLARILTEYGDPAEAESLLRAALQRFDPENKSHRPHYIVAQNNLGQALLALGRTDDALPILERALELVRGEFGDDNWRTADAQLALGTALVAKQRVADAEPLLLAARATLDKNAAAQPRLATQAAAAVASLTDPARRN
jgi:eukaryotic-like serine/threonine-protein kinase